MRAKQDSSKREKYISKGQKSQERNERDKKE